MGSEAADLEQASGDVVGQVAEPECGAAQVFEPSVEPLGRPVASAGSFEVGELPLDPPAEPGPLPEFSQLSMRERDVLRLLASGARNAEISEELLISVNTVKFHVSNLLRKVGARNRAQLIATSR